MSAAALIADHHPILRRLTFRCSGLSGNSKIVSSVLTVVGRFVGVDLITLGLAADARRGVPVASGLAFGLRFAADGRFGDADVLGVPVVFCVVSVVATWSRFDSITVFSSRSSGR